MHSGTAAQLTAEQADAPPGRLQHIPLAQSWASMQRSSMAAQVSVQTEPLGLAQHFPELHCPFWVHACPLSSGAPGKQVLCSQWNPFAHVPWREQEVSQTPAKQV
jgi:hypothetical protein